MLNRTLTYTSELFLGNKLAADLFFFIPVMGAVVLTFGELFFFSATYRSIRQQSLEDRDEEYIQRYVLINDSAQYNNHVKKWRKICLVIPLIFLSGCTWLLVLFPRCSISFPWIAYLVSSIIIVVYHRLEEGAKAAIEIDMFGDNVCYEESLLKQRSLVRIMQSEQLLPISWLVWLPLTTLSLLPIITNNVFYSKRIALIGAIICVFVASRSKANTRVRAAVCGGTTVVCWLLMLVLNHFILKAGFVNLEGSTRWLPMWLFAFAGYFTWV